MQKSLLGGIMRTNRLVKSTAALALPSLLAALMAFQIHLCKEVFDLRNSYLLQNLPATSQRIWDDVSGSTYPYIYQSSLKSEVSEQQWKLEHNSLDFLRHYRDSVLQTGMPSLTVHFLWCDDGYFELHHYITIRSLLHQLRPDKIVIHYRIRPRKDPGGYWRWLEDLERDVIMLSLRPLRDAKYCRHDLSSGVTMEHFSDPHGIFILGNVVITNLTRDYVIDQIAKSFSKEDLSGPQALEKLGKSQVFIVSDDEPYHISQSPGRIVIPCPTDSIFNAAPKSKTMKCVSLQTYVGPEELFRMESRFYNFARTLIYGSPQPIEIDMASSNQIPSILHIFMENGSGYLTPFLYLTIKSASLKGKVKEVFIHCANAPQGQFWNRLVSSDGIKPVFIPTESMIKSESKRSLESYLLYTLLQHGGIAIRGDFIFTKPISSINLRAGAITTIHKSQYREKHRSLDTAILAAAPGSKFVKDALGMIYQPGQSHIDIGLDEVATHLSEVNPRTVLIDPLLMSNHICRDQKCVTAGGHDPPELTTTTRLIWEEHPPLTITEFINMEVPVRAVISDLMVT